MQIKSVMDNTIPERSDYKSDENSHDDEGPDIHEQVDETEHDDDVVPVGTPGELLVAGYMLQAGYAVILLAL